LANFRTSREVAMKFAICNETFQDWPFDKAFRFAAELGYAGLEIAPFTIHTSAFEISPARRAEVRQLADDAGLPIIGLHWLLAKTTGYYLTTPDDAVRHKTADYFCELARLCRDLGGHLMVLGSPLQRNLLPGVTHEQAMELAADCLRRAMPTIEECGVTLAVEPLSPKDGDFLLTAEKGVELCEMVGSPNCRLHLDCKAMSSEAKPIPQLLRENKQLLVHFHANDPNLRGPGMGELDFVPIFQTLADIDYRGWVSVEVFDYSPGVEALARESIEYMQKCAAKVTGA
jgi:sugar phosphate isomerase/epimerase